ncbi:MAG: biopolymer transporter ExbD [Bacteroidetes bacterium]|nr:MAG: biopolymer transporter ExbD [Bacteroidota bacterium]
MALKKRSKVNAEFSMASLTDMIFLLLIFFVLNSSVVAPNSLNLKLPGTSQAKLKSDSKTDDVSISLKGNYYLNGKRVSATRLEEALAKKAGRSSGTLDITISPAKGTPVKYVAFVMDIAMRYQINAILAAEE